MPPPREYPFFPFRNQQSQGTARRLNFAFSKILRRSVLFFHVSPQRRKKFQGGLGAIVSGLSLGPQPHSSVTSSRGLASSLGRAGRSSARESCIVNFAACSHQPISRRGRGSLLAGCEVSTPLPTLHAKLSCLGLAFHFLSPRVSLC